ncbi:MAG: YajQ family cyclic di-GMP-binding protein [Mariprofundaceae bacterium]|nr:YajQ family cyclic di-GMP-binding protein [Mariprofundaceae bacterium]
MPSFDIVSKTDLQEVDNAINQVQREITTRYDFKNSKASIEHKENEITIVGDDEYKINTVTEILRTKMVRRKLDCQCLDYGKVETAGGNTCRQVIKVKQGLDIELAKKIVQHLKKEKLKVQASIQGDQVRITGKKRDDLQQAIASVKGIEVELPLQYINFRD